MLKGVKAKSKKETVSAEQLEQQQRQRTAQQWMPVADINRNTIVRKDNTLVGILRIQPINIELLSDSERKKKVEALVEGLNGQNEAMQFFCIGRPVDLNSYLEWMQDKARAEQDFTRKMLLKGYIQQASRTATSGETTERRFYLIISKEIKPKAEDELSNRLENLKAALSQAELESHICNEDELMDVLSLFANPIQAAFEQVELEYQIPSILK